MRHVSGWKLYLIRLDDGTELERFAESERAAWDGVRALTVPGGDWEGRKITHVLWQGTYPK